jgi:hypothetical protein
MLDEHNGHPIDWGTVVISLAGIQYSLVYDYGAQTYTVDIWLNELEPGDYILNITAMATDCTTVYGEIQLRVDFKIRYTIVLDVADEVQVGQTIQVSILASYESGPLENFFVTVHIVVERGTLADLEFIEVASDSLEFTIPSDATRVRIWAEFQGAPGEWDAISNTLIRDIKSSVFLYENPVTLMTIAGGSGGLIVGLVFLKRRKGKVSLPTTSSPTAINASPPVTLAPTAPASEMELLQERIIENPSGLTRAQIAQSLEISTSKAGAMVKKLLESDSTFEEIREGRLRKIRFSGGK